MSSFIVIYLRGWKEDPPPHKHTQSFPFECSKYGTKCTTFFLLQLGGRPVSLYSTYVRMYVTTTEAYATDLQKKSSCNYHFQKTMICCYFFFVYRNIDDECRDELRTIQGTKKSWPPLLNYIAVVYLSGFLSKLKFSLGFLYICH